MVIVSTLAGRLRVRSQRLRSAQRAQAVARKVAEIDGVSDVQINAAAGSLCVCFDPARLESEQLEQMIEQLVEPDATGDLVPRVREGLAGMRRSTTLNRVTKVGMMGSLGVSLALAAAGRKKAHAAFGTGFVAFAALHMLRNANRLLR